MCCKASNINVNYYYICAVNTINLQLVYVDFKVFDLLYEDNILNYQVKYKLL